MGAEVESVTRGNEGLAEAVDAAMEDLVANTDETHYLVGSAVGPDPFPRMVREFQSLTSSHGFSRGIPPLGMLAMSFPRRQFSRQRYSGLCAPRWDVPSRESLIAPTNSGRPT